MGQDLAVGGRHVEPASEGRSPFVLLTSLLTGSPGQRNSLHRRGAENAEKGGDRGKATVNDTTFNAEHAESAEEGEAT